MSIKKALFFGCSIVFAAALAVGCGGGKTGGGGKSTSGVKMGSFVDSRDSHTYRTVTIGGITWMAENLNSATGDHWCYGDNAFNCKKYGELYPWKTAMSVCPGGWHLPSEAEWDKFVELVGGGDEHAAGKKLKSKDGWEDKEGNKANGTDEIGFAALPGGLAKGGADDDDEEGSGFDGLGKAAAWWTATEHEEEETVARVKTMEDSDRVRGGDALKSFGASVRCVKD